MQGVGLLPRGYSDTWLGRVLCARDLISEDRHRLSEVRVRLGEVAASGGGSARVSAIVPTEIGCLLLGGDEWLIAELPHSTVKLPLRRLVLCGVHRGWRLGLRRRIRCTW